MPRENGKCRQWEKQRRDRLKDGFLQLAKVLPCYDPSINICKIDILHKAASSIEELQVKLKTLLSLSSNAEKKTETDDLIKKLQDRIKKLLVRNEQLSNLLRDAGISVPSACGTIKNFRQKRWSRKILPEQAKLLQKKEMEKENLCTNLVHGKKRKIKKTNTNSPKRRSNIARKNITRRKRRNTINPASNYFILLSQPPSLQRDLNQRCYLVTQPCNSIPKDIKLGAVTTDIFPKPFLVTFNDRQSKNISQNNASSPILGSGTLVLGNGTIMRVLPQQNNIPQQTFSNLLINSVVNLMPKLTKAQQNNCTKKNMAKSVSQTSVNYRSINTLPVIQPKYCFTKTTQINKVPIPALTSRYANNDLLLSKSSTKHNEEKIKKASKSTLETGDSTKSNKPDKQISNKRKLDAKDENNSKKRKDDCKTDSLEINKICDGNVDNNTNPAVIVNNSITECTQTDVSNKTEVKGKENSLVKETVTDNNKKDIENCVAQEIVISDANVIEKIRPDDISKICDTIQKDNVSSQETVVTSTTLTSTATITTNQDDIKNLDLNLSHSELSNDIFASLQVPSGCQNPESTSPTAAFLLAFPLVSSGVKITEVIEEENSDSQRGTPTLLQIGTIETTKSTQSHTETITTNFLNLDNFSFLPSKDVCSNFYTNNYSSNNKSESCTLTASSNCVNKTNATANKSIYVNVKSPNLPQCLSEPVKDNYMFDLKSVNSSKIANVGNSEKKGNHEKVNNNADFNSQNQSTSKPNMQYTASKDQNQKSTDQKSRYYTSTYSNSTCNFNYRNEAVKPCTNSYINIGRSYTNPLYTNCSNYNYNYHPDTNFNQNYYKNIPRNEAKAYYPLNYENYPDYRKNDSNNFSGYYETTYAKDSKNYNVNKTKPQNKLPINWMTTPDNRLPNSECLLNSFSKGDFTQTYPFNSYVTSTTTYFTSTSTDTTNVSCIMEAKKCLELPPPVALNSHQKLDVEEKQFSWSPTKLPHFLDHPQNLVASTLPMLVGDLALGNTLPFGEPKNEYKHVKENKDLKRNNKNNSFENQNNFLSVSQLVDHNKPENVPAKISSRRNSGNRSKNTLQQKTKKSNKQESKNVISNCGINNDKMCERVVGNYNVMANVDIFSEQKSRNVVKNTSSSYSAEALIGNQVSEETDHKRYPPPSNKSLGTSSFLAENIISYFPPVDLAQDSYMSQGQNYQSNNFTHNICTSHNNTYGSNSFIYAPSTITSTYLPTTNFDGQHHDFLPDNFVTNAVTKDKHYNIKHLNNKQHLNKDDKNSHNPICQNNFKKSKKKQVSDTGNTLANFEFPFISLPGSNNSPILPDDFHCHTNFLPPTPFSCKNSLYPKQNDLSSNSILPLPSVSRSNTQHPEISPINSAGTSLTNFNLSAIFPEINKGPIADVYPDARGKEHSHKICTSSSPQVPFNSEPKFSFST